MSFDMHCTSTFLVFFGEASMLGHGAGIGYTASAPGWAPLTISVWWRGRPCAWLSGPSRQLFSTRKYSLPYRIVSARVADIFRRRLCEVMSTEFVLDPMLYTMRINL